jgi:hypothetical protein
MHRYDKLVNQLAVFLVTVAGAVLGALPYLAFLGSLKFAAIYLAGSLLVAVVPAVSQVPAGSGQPKVGEYLLALVGCAALLAAVTWYGFALYGLAYGAMHTIGVVGRWLALAQPANPSSVAFWVSGPFTAASSLLALLGGNVSRTLSTPAVSAVSVYDSLLRKGTLWWAVPLVDAGAALAIVTYFFWPGSWWLYLVSSFLIFGAGSQSFELGVGLSSEGLVRRLAIRALQKLYAVLGYRTVVSPRTKAHNADVDSLFKRVDILATREQDALVIELKTRQTNDTVSAVDASFLPIAARAVSRFLSQDIESPVRAQPILVLVDQKPTEDLARLAEGEGITVLALTKKAVLEVLNTEDETVLRQLAQRYLSSGPTSMFEQIGPSATASAT